MFKVEVEVESICMSKVTVEVESICMSEGKVVGESICMFEASWLVCTWVFGISVWAKVTGEWVFL
jgi:hypothetical protein